MKRRTMLAGLGTSGVVLGGAALMRPWKDRLTPLIVPARAAGAQGIAAAPVIEEMVKGSDDAPVTVIEYASFTCPHCARFHADVFPLIEENYIRPGHVRFVYREVYFDRPGLWAAMVARCSGRDRYFAVVDRIYETQHDWTQGEPAAIAENLLRIGRSVGMSDEELDRCLTDGAMAEAMFNTYEAQVAEHNITATPSFVIGGELYSNMRYASLASILDEHLATQK
ncbi:MAG: DsbA family protein [Rhodobacteraceae bacterium]|nr:DsbA family protein [Paracoccaceae bacterium]